VIELSDEKWLWYLAVLYDIRYHISWSGNVSEETMTSVQSRNRVPRGNVLLREL
jgi:hypothetical protein